MADRTLGRRSSERHASPGPAGEGHRLGRRALATPAAPVRAVHLGLGAFHRAHQAWYLSRMPEPWGVAAFTGRTAAAAAALAPQDGLYTLLTRGAEHDDAEVVTTLSAVHDGTDQDAWRRYLADPAVGLVTLTVTEAGYRTGTAAARLADGLRERRSAGSGGLTIASCDNLAGNGAVTRAAVLAACLEAGGHDLADWAAEHVAFPSSMVDRITPRPTAADQAAAERATDYADAAPVVTEPFSEWVAEEALRDAAPGLAAAGVTFVPDVTPYERRKLFVLNGGHSLLAYAGPPRGHETVAACLADGELTGWLEQWWDEAGAVLGFPPAELTAYRTATRVRFANPRIRHLLAQIAADGSVKLPVRAAEVIRAVRGRGVLPDGAARLLAGWLLHLRGQGVTVADPAAGPLRERVRTARDPHHAAAVVVGHVVPDHADDAELITRVAVHARRMESAA
ncbi:mannitol dehydrogenase family protein [Jiangella endophytica]|uniref:mannitol dehydrogenase family protein n=1 Tax=Jiangella endophytica TaxID=1623398 RepID=UPI0018E5376F|nr:mannitol dehydrogenase family protein [Jiangella endophytica]